MASPHQVLGVDPDADRETVERRYRELVKEVHPDAGGSAEEFKRVRRAYRAIVSDRASGASTSGRQGGATDASRRERTGGTGGTGGTGPGSSRSGSGGGRTSATGGHTGSTGGRTGSAGDRTGSGSDGAGSNRRGTGSDRRRSGAAGGTNGESSRQYTAAGRGNRTASAAGAGQGAAGATGSGSGASAAGSRQGTSANRTQSGDGDTGWVSRRWFLYGFSALFAGGAYALRDQTLSDLLAEDSGGQRPERSAATGLPIQDTASRQIGPDELFDVGFETPAESTVHFTVEGADSRDWINVYTREAYERVASNWDGQGEFDPGEPLETVLTSDGYVSDLPEAGTYVILIKLWAGPPNDPREPRTVKVSYEVTA